MKLHENMRYPHPVLSEFSNDYASGEFSCSFIQQMTSEGELMLTSNLALDSEDLRLLVASQKAATGYFLVCRRTYYNSLQTVPLGETVRYFDGSRLFGAVTIRPAVWTLENVERFRSRHIHREFGTSTDLPKGSIVALGPEFRFTMDKRRFKPFESIFELAQNDSVAPGMISVDPTLDRITIFAESKTYNDLADMRNAPATRNMLLGAVYMPAVMEVVAQLQNGGGGITGTAWYRIFQAKCDKLGLDPANANASPLDIAQKLLRAPLRKTIAAAGSA